MTTRSVDWAKAVVDERGRERDGGSKHDTTHGKPLTNVKGKL